jgi:hypothetical protein
MLPSGPSLVRRRTSVSSTTTARVGHPAAERSRQTSAPKCRRAGSWRSCDVRTLVSAAGRWRGLRPQLSCRSGRHPRPWRCLRRNTLRSHPGREKPCRRTAGTSRTVRLACANRGQGPWLRGHARAVRSRQPKSCAKRYPSCAGAAPNVRSCRRERAFESQLPILAGTQREPVSRSKSTQNGGAGQC